MLAAAAARFAAPGGGRQGGRGWWVSRLGARGGEAEGGACGGPGTRARRRQRCCQGRRWRPPTLRVPPPSTLAPSWAACSLGWGGGSCWVRAFPFQTAALRHPSATAAEVQAWLLADATPNVVIGPSQGPPQGPRAGLPPPHRRGELGVPRGGGTPRPRLVNPQL